MFHGSGSNSSLLLAPRFCAQNDIENQQLIDEIEKTLHTTRLDKVSGKTERAFQNEIHGCRTDSDVEQALCKYIFKPILPEDFDIKSQYPNVQGANMDCVLLDAKTDRVNTVIKFKYDGSHGEVECANFITVLADKKKYAKRKWITVVCTRQVMEVGLLRWIPFMGTTTVEGTDVMKEWLYTPLLFTDTFKLSAPLNLMEWVIKKNQEFSSESVPSIPTTPTFELSIEGGSPGKRAFNCPYGKVWLEGDKVYKLVDEEDLIQKDYEQLLKDYHTISPELEAVDLGVVTTDLRRHYHLFSFNYIERAAEWSKDHVIDLLKRVKDVATKGDVVGDLRLGNLIPRAKGTVSILDLSWYGPRSARRFNRIADVNQFPFLKEAGYTDTEGWDSACLGQILRGNNNDRKMLPVNMIKRLLAHWNKQEELNEEELKGMMNKFKSIPHPNQLRVSTNWFTDSYCEDWMRTGVRHRGGGLFGHWG